METYQLIVSRLDSIDEARVGLGEFRWVTNKYRAIVGTLPSHVSLDRLRYVFKKFIPARSEERVKYDEFREGSLENLAGFVISRLGKSGTIPPSTTGPNLQVPRLLTAATIVERDEVRRQARDVQDVALRTP